MLTRVWGTRRPAGPRLHQPGAWELRSLRRLPGPGLLASLVWNSATRPPSAQPGSLRDRLWHPFPGQEVCMLLQRALGVGTGPQGKVGPKPGLQGSS